MPHVTRLDGPHGNAVYQVGSRSFVFFRNPRPDAFDPQTGERYDDVIVIWVESEADKLALVQDDRLPFFTTAHFDGHPSVLVRACRLGELEVGELAEIVQDAVAVPRLCSAGKGLVGVAPAGVLDMMLT